MFTDQIRKGHFSSYRFVLQVCSLSINDFKVKIELLVVEFCWYISCGFTLGVSMLSFFLSVYSLRLVPILLSGILL